MARRRWVTVEVLVRQHIDNQTFTTVRKFEVPANRELIKEEDLARLRLEFVGAYSTSEFAANKAWKKLGDNNPQRFHTRAECNNPNCRSHKR